MTFHLIYRQSVTYKAMYLHIFILFLMITTAYQECTQEQNMVISCTSLLDLKNKQVNFANVTIVPDRHLDIRMQTIKPSLQLSLTDDGNTISESKLTQLDELSNNIFERPGIETIRTDFFSNSPFKTISWSNGEISSIEMGAFSHSNDLTEVSIVNHKLTTIRRGVFSDLNLVKLSLSGNRIRLIERNAFRNMVKLESLHLDHNIISDFQPEVLFNYGGTIENLYLNDNFITDFDSNLVRGLTNIRVLNLENNRISRISSYTLEYLSKLERLSLSNNLLVNLDSSIFPENGLPSLSKLLINNNQLSYLTPITLEKLRGLKEIGIVGNPWHCHCYEALRVWLDAHYIESVCDEAYSDGSKPVCVQIDEHSYTCDHAASFDQNKFTNKINMTPMEMKCEL